MLVAFLLSLTAVADQPTSVAPPPPLVIAPPPPPVPMPDPRQASRPHGVRNLVSLFSQDDYPVDAIRRGEEGNVSVRMTITPEGRVGACEILSSSGSASLDRATCAIFQRRARFTPARDAQGIPTTDHYTQRVRWELPRTPVWDEYGRAAFALDPATGFPACIFEERVNLDVTCDSIGPIRDEVVAAHNLPPIGVLVVEQGQRIGKGEELRNAGTGSGRQRLQLVAATLTIDAEGLVTACSASFANLNPTDVRDHCQEVRGTKFERLPDARSPRYVTVYRLAYLRK